jgi:hypothetical protein
MLDGELGDFSDVISSSFLSKTGETKGGLTTSTVLFGEIDRKLVDDISGVSSEGSEELEDEFRYSSVHYVDIQIRYHHFLISISQTGKGKS